MRSTGPFPPIGLPPVGTNSEETRSTAQLLEMLSRMPRLVGGASPSILVAEDDMMTRMLMRKALVQAGYQVLEAENGYSALKMFDQQRPDVVLLDVMMPQIDGFSVCEEIRQRPGGDSVPVLIVTGLEDIDSITRAYDVGATDFITKPINWMVLSHRVRYALRVSQAQEEMLKNQAQLVAAQRIAHMGNWEWQLEGQNVLDFSIEASRILGLSEEPRQFALPELYGLVHPDDLPAVKEFFEGLRHNQQPAAIDHRIVLPNMAERVVHQVAEIRQSDDGRQTVLGIIQDISERKRVEEMLRVTQFSVDRAADAIFWTDPDGSILYVNDAACRSYGYSRDDLLMMKFDDLSLANEPEDWETYWNNLINQGSFKIERRHKTQDGGSMVVQITSNYLKYGDREYNCSFIQDITARKQAEDELRTAKEQAEIASRTKSEFLANMSHELRTPLNAIIGFSDVLRKQMFGDLGNEKYLEYSSDINTSGQHLLHVINDILDLSKIEAGKFVISEHPFSIPKFVAAAMRIVQGGADTSELRLSSSLPDNLPALRGDERVLTQVLLNLLSNAVKFTPKGGRVTVTVAIAKDDNLTIEVKDTGIGIAPEDIPRALSPFVQIDSSLSRRYSGTGLGLPLSKKLVELHNGTLAIDSVLGVGTNVICTFPADRLLWPSDDKTSKQNHRSKPATNPNSSADDNDDHAAPATSATPANHKSKQLAKPLS